MHAEGEGGHVVGEQLCLAPLGVHRRARRSLGGRAARFGENQLELGGGGGHLGDTREIAQGVRCMLGENPLERENPPAARARLTPSGPLPSPGVASATASCGAAEEAAWRGRYCCSALSRASLRCLRPIICTTCEIHGRYIGSQMHALSACTS